MSQPENSKKNEDADRRMAAAQSNLQRMLETIAPYSPAPAKAEEEPPLRWVGDQSKVEVVIQIDQ